jgi:hypothetical protein
MQRRLQLFQHADIFQRDVFPALVVRRSVGLEVPLIDRLAREAAADRQHGAVGRNRPDGQPPHAVLRAAELRGRMQEHEVRALLCVFRQAVDRLEWRLGAVHDRDAALGQHLHAHPFADTGETHRLLRADGGRMHGAGVVGFHCVFNEKLPVALGLDVLAPGDDHVAHVVRVEQIGEIADIVFHRRRVVAVIDENEPRPGLQPDRQQPIFGFVETVGLVHRGRRQHRAVQPVAPGVVRAEDLARSAAALQQQRAAVAAEIGKGAQRAGLVLHDQGRSTHCLDRSVLARIGPLIDTADDDPAPRVNVFDLGLEECFRGVAIRRQTARLRQRRALPDIA